MEPTTSLSGRTDSTPGCGNCKIRLETILSNHLQGEKHEIKKPELQGVRPCYHAALLNDRHRLSHYAVLCGNMQVLYLLEPGPIIVCPAKHSDLS